jgi:hypothetical protein
MMFSLDVELRLDCQRSHLMSALIRWAHDGLLDEHAISDIQPVRRQTKTQDHVGRNLDFPEYIGQSKSGWN